MENRTSICINCETKTIGKYCHNCKQKTDTKRLGVAHFIQEDIIHGALHFDKGLLFTLKEILLRPAVVAQNYIQGKRARYYNFFYLSLILIGFTILLKPLKESPIPTSNNPNYLESMQFAAKNIKFILLSFIPFFALSSRIVYRKVRYNFAEHAIIASICVVYFLLYNLASDVMTIVGLKKVFDPILTLLINFVVVYIYYQTFKEFYQNRKYINFINALLTLALFLILFVLMVSIIVFIITYK